MYNLLRRLAVKIVITKEANLVDRVYGIKICLDAQLGEMRI
jgi:hypothetical protein